MALMKKSGISCIKSVDGLICPKCKSLYAVKNGKTSAGTQRYCCKQCGLSYIIDFKNKACNKNSNFQIVLFIKEGLGIRSIARLLSISTTTVLERIVSIAANIKKPAIPIGKSYEVDEMRTFVGTKNCLYWIVYALERESKRVVDFSIGNRTNKTLEQVITSLKLSSATKIYTDGLKNYRTLIPQKLHSTHLHATNHIERNNLTVRTHLKRLNRKTICFSRKRLFLQSVLKIYFWS